jgi:hypothetical protein
MRARILLASTVAAAGAIVLAFAASASAGQWMWAKSLATYELQQKFGGTASCVPVGAHERRNGVNLYSQFTCTLADSNGATFVDVIVPKTRTAFSLVSTRQITQVSPPSPAVPTYTVPSCPSGWYVNTYGSCIPGPSTDPSLPVPGGPTAICADGTYSYSQSRSGTCSWHGGVSTWLN